MDAFNESISRTGNVFGSFFVQVDLGWVRSVSGVATQGLDDMDGNFVSQYKLNFSTDGSVWKSYMERPSIGSKVYWSGIIFMEIKYKILGYILNNEASNGHLARP